MSNDSNISHVDNATLLHQIDKKIGGKIKAARMAQGLSRKQLAEAIGVSTEQINKYETASNRTSASRLTLIANILSKKPSYFYSDIIDEDSEEEYTKRQTRSLIMSRNFSKIKSEKTQIALSRLISSLINEQEL
jgi:transcriptional regulator with XRE-family HTH domain